MSVKWKKKKHSCNVWNALCSRELHRLLSCTRSKGIVWFFSSRSSILRFTFVLGRRFSLLRRASRTRGSHLCLYKPPTGEAADHTLALQIDYANELNLPSSVTLTFILSATINIYAEKRTFAGS